MDATATLFDADEAGYAATVEVLGVIYSAEDDGYAVLEVQDAESGEGFALVGPVAHLNAGDRAEVSGEWQTHSRYGRQLRARGALPLDPADRAGRIAYLTSLRHIGPARAERLVDEHGEEVLGTIAADPAAVFGSLRGVSGKQAAAAAESWHASRAVRDLHVQLAPHGLAHLAAPVHRRFGDRAMAILHEDPYRLTEVDGVGFARADKIALAADVPPESPRRAQAAATYALAEAEQQGHTHLPLDELALRTAKLTGLAARPRLARRGAGAAARGGPRLPGADPRLGGRRRRDAAGPGLAAAAARAPARRGARGRAHRRAVGRGARRLRRADLGPDRRPGRRQDGLHPGDRRRGARPPTRRSPSAPRPGAPRGAWRKRPATEAQTIHRMLEWMPGRDPAFRPGHPLPVDLVIVDESSMLNLRLAEVLLDGLAESTHVVFVGDADQLPPIGAGKPFEDLIASGIAPVVRLNQIFRQAARSMITTAAHEINGGRPPHLEPEEGQDHDFFFIDRPNPERALATVVEVVAERVPERFEHGPDPRRPGAGADVPGRGRHRRAQRAPPGAPQPATASRR